MEWYKFVCHISCCQTINIFQVKLYIWMPWNGNISLIYTKQLFTYNTIVFVRVLTTVYDKLSISFRPHQDAKIFPQEWRTTFSPTAASLFVPAVLFRFGFSDFEGYVCISLGYMYMLDYSLTGTISGNPRFLPETRSPIEACVWHQIKRSELCKKKNSG